VPISKKCDEVVARRDTAVTIYQNHWLPFNMIEIPSEICISIIFGDNKKAFIKKSAVKRRELKTWTVSREYL